MPTVFITGANRGIGLEFSRQYLAENWRVIATCRNPISPGPLAQLQGKLEVHGLDVTNERQIAHLAENLETVPFDLLINNAGIYGPKSYDLDDIDTQVWSEVIRTNAIMPFKVTTAFLKNLDISKNPIVVNISSIMGSIENNKSGGGYIYRSSKAALNGIMKSLALDLKNRGVAVYLFHPGWVQTDMGGPSASLTVLESVSSMRKVIDKLSMENTGCFINYDGTSISW